MKNSDRKKILFLYTELAGYFISCVKELAEKNNVEVHIVRWPINKEAPFGFNFPGSIKIYERSGYAEKELYDLVEEISPDLIYCAGWMDKGYLGICKKWRGKVSTILGFDNKWEGSLKQRLSLIYAKTIFLDSFSQCFIPGEPQISFAKKMGFNAGNILTGVYCADVSYFNGLYSKYIEQKERNFPKRFVFVGRYNEAKDVETLWKAFIEIQQEQPNDWELWCIGTGDVKPIIHPKIKHMGFVQPSDIWNYISETGVFVLPSKFEPWGVVVHEFAAAGFPLICSNRVGAASSFLEEGSNGFIFQGGNVEELKKCFNKIIDMNNGTLLAMAKKSVELSLRITPKKWSETLLKLLN